MIILCPLGRANFRISVSQLASLKSPFQFTLSRLSTKCLSHWHKPPTHHPHVRIYWFSWPEFSLLSLFFRSSRPVGFCLKPKLFCRCFFFKVIIKLWKEQDLHRHKFDKTTFYFHIADKTKRSNRCEKLANMSKTILFYITGKTKRSNRCEILANLS